MPERAAGGRPLPALGGRPMLRTCARPGTDALDFRRDTDGLPDSIPGNSAEDSLYRALDSDLSRTMSNLKALV